MATTVAADTTPVRLLDAAERLVGERGVDGVSLRAINTEAGSNVAAAHYHFGSKAVLVRAVLDRRMAVLGDERLRQLDALATETAPSARAVVAVFVGPLFDFAATPEGRRYVRFLAALHRAGGEWLEVLDAAFAPQWARLEPVLSSALPALDAERRGRRLALASEVQLSMLADPDRYAGALDPDHYRDEVIDVFTAIVTGPSHQEAP